MSGEITVILDKKQIVARIDSSTLRIDRPGARPDRIPLNMIGQVIVRGNPMVSCDVWRELTERNIAAVLLPSRGKGGVAYLCSGLSSNVLRRTAQYRVAFDRQRALRISKWLVSEKLDGQSNVIRKICPDHSTKYLQLFEQYKRSVNNAGTCEEIMGYEGNAAAMYFRVIASFLPSKWKFDNRNRRPPKDPVNSLLSLCYVITGSEVLRAIQEKGLDPAVGYLHSIKPGRQSLMLDVIEPVRPRVDLFVLKLLDSTLVPKDFTSSAQDGCRLSKKGRSVFYKKWAEWVCLEDSNQNFMFLLREIIRHIIDFIETDEEEL